MKIERYSSSALDRIEQLIDDVVTEASASRAKLVEVVSRTRVTTVYDVTNEETGEKGTIVYVPNITAAELFPKGGKAVK